MADRVLVGKGTAARGTSNYGIWVSKPGFNVQTCDSEDLLFDSERAYMQMMAQGSIANTAGAVSHSAVTRSGQSPLVIWKPQDGNTIYSKGNAGGYSGNPLFSASGSKAVDISISVTGETANVTLTPNTNISANITYYTMRPE